MALKIRLRGQGKKNSPFFRLVLTESRNPRDGKYIEALGWYNPFEEELEKALSVQGERVSYWLEKGAVITESAEALVKKSCPQVILAYRQKRLAKTAKECEKRRESKKK
jgi:small subunit ribosomal protein S16